MAKANKTQGIGWNLEIMFNPQLRPIIFNHPIGPRSKMGCTSYVYKITNTQDGKIYIGYHKEDDKRYYTSTTNPELKQLLASNIPGLFDYEILFWGSVNEAKQKEFELLTEVSAAKNPNYYNRNNGRPGIRAVNIKGVNELTDEVDDIRKHQYLKQHFLLSRENNVIELSVNELWKISKLQTRELELDSTNLHKIMGRIRNRIGHYEMPVIVENFITEGVFHEKILISGNHTRTALYKTKDENVGHTGDTLIKCVLITEDVHENFQESEIWILSNNLNAEYNVGKPFSVEDGIVEVIELEKKGHSWETLEMRDRLMRLGLSSSQVDNVFNKVYDSIIKDGWKKEGQMVFDYVNTPEHKKILQDVVDDYQKQGYFVMPSASGNPHLYRWIEKWVQHQLTRIVNGLPIQERIKIVVYHTNTRSSDNWKSLWEMLIRVQNLPRAKDGHRFTDNELQLIKNHLKLPDFSYHEMPMKGKSFSNATNN
jgi:hypothetical protein